MRVIAVCGACGARMKLARPIVMPERIHVPCRVCETRGTADITEESFGKPDQDFPTSIVKEPQ